MAEPRLIRLRREGACARCGADLAVGADALWDQTNKTVTCAACAGQPKQVHEGAAGASARAMQQKLRGEQEQRRQELKRRRPILGRLAIAVSGPPTAGAAYAKGADGEEKLGAFLDAMSPRGILVLHDRRRPRTTANIDHLVVAGSGVWVIDAKHYAGRLAKTDKGGWFRSDLRLTVGGRDRTNLVAGVQKQMADVQLIVAGSPVPDAVVLGALCFIEVDLPLFAKPFSLDGVLITWRKPLGARLAEPGPLDAEQRAALHRHLAAKLRPAG